MALSVLQPGRLAALAVLALVGASLAGCIDSNFRAPVFEGGKEVANAPPAPPPAPMKGFYTVQRGDTLYSIAWRENLDFRALANWNGIPSSYTIHPGQQLRLGPPSGAVASYGAAAQQSPPNRTQPSYPDDDRIETNLHWRWPTEGPLAGGYSEGDAGRKGILISGRDGQPIMASEKGRVVYSGSGIPGYGRLVIVKHDKYYLSAYGHNRKILVKEGDPVAAGQQIAEMGRTGRDQPLLHFEIRYQGKAVNPARLLPPR